MSEAERSTILLNEVQIAVLGWIKDGCPDGVYPDDSYSHRVSARALQSRGLILISGRGARWQATLTERGRAWPAATPEDAEVRKRQEHAK